MIEAILHSTCGAKKVILKWQENGCFLGFCLTDTLSCSRSKKKYSERNTCETVSTTNARNLEFSPFPTESVINLWICMLEKSIIHQIKLWNLLLVVIKPNPKGLRTMCFSTANQTWKIEFLNTWHGRHLYGVISSYYRESSKYMALGPKSVINENNSL